MKVRSAPTQSELIKALVDADAALRDIYVRTGDLAAARAHDRAFEVVCRAEAVGGIVKALGCSEAPGAGRTGREP